MWTGTRGKSSVKILDCLARICQSNSWLPRAVRNVVAHPVHVVFQLAAPKSGVEDRIDLKLLHTVHLDCWRRGHDSAWERICHVGLQEADMENWMDLNGRWQGETKS